MLTPAPPVEQLPGYSRLHPGDCLRLPLLLKYQKLIQQFSRDNVQLGERLGARTYALEKANEEMRLEIAERGRVEKALMESESGSGRLSAKPPSA